ncbi:mutator type transposase [Tanacetum coccineum]
MKDKFEMSDLILLAYYLGIEVTQTGGDITIKQTGYINKILKESSMMESNDTKIPMDPGTKYLLHTRPDLSYSVGLLSRFMQDPKDHHLKSIKQKQPTMALSSCESEFMAATRAACQALWLKRLLSEITGWDEERITLKVDNISVIALVRTSFSWKKDNRKNTRIPAMMECVLETSVDNHTSAIIDVCEGESKDANENTMLGSFILHDIPAAPKGQQKVKSPIFVQGWMVNWVDDIDSDIFSIVEVTSMMKELGYQNLCMAYYYKKPNTYLDNGLTKLAIDKDAYEMLMYVDKFKVIELYTHHSVNKKHVLIQEPLGTASKPNEPDIGSRSKAEVDVSEDEWLKEALKKLSIKSKKGQQPSRKEVGESSRKEVGQSSKNGSGSENGSDSSSGSDSEDSDYFVDEENLIDDVNVDMAEFKSHTDPNVEWVGCKEKVIEENEVFDLEEVDHETFDSKLVKEKVTRVSVEQRRQLWLKKNDKLKVRVVCRGQVPEFANNNMGTIVPVTCNPKGPTSKVQPKSISKKEKVTKPKRILWLSLGYATTFLSREVEESIKPNPKIPLSALKDQLQKKFEVGVSKQKVFRAKKMAYEKEINPNTTVKIESRGRDFLGLDGCFPSGPYPGQILTAVGVDPNNRIYPLAYVVVESESKDSWKWFLDCLCDDLELFKNSNFTFISDRQKRGKLYKELLWKCAMATTIQKFDKRMEEMKNHNIEAYEWLRKIPPQHWARSHFLGRAKSNILLNNMCEVLNRQLAAAKLKVDWNGSDLYQVSCPWGDQFVVNMIERDMASNGTDTGIPESYYNPCHWLSTWKKMYMFNINPVNGLQAWKKSDVLTTIILPKPHLQIGRPPKKRKKSAAELADEIMKSNKMTRPHRQHRLQLEEDARVKKVDMLVLVDKGMEMSFIDLNRPGII